MAKKHKKLPAKKNATVAKPQSPKKKWRWLAWLSGIAGVALIITLLLHAVSPSYFTCHYATASQLAFPELRVTAEDWAAIKNITNQQPNYSRLASSTYLTFPEWYIVFSSQEYASVLTEGRPSQFHYFSAIKQYWASYDCVTKWTADSQPYNEEAHLVSQVIGVSFAVENAIKGLHENTIGRVTEMLSLNRTTAEDRFAAQVATEYGDSLHTTAWYYFPFGSRLVQFWMSEMPVGANMPRKLERRTVFTLEMLTKVAYGAAIRTATESTLDPATLETYMIVSPVPERVLAAEPRIKIVGTVDDRFQVISVPRYSEMTEITQKLAQANVQFLQIAGNDELMITAFAPANWPSQNSDFNLVFEMSVLSDMSKKRVAIRVPVTTLGPTLEELWQQGFEVEHIYDY